MSKLDAASFSITGPKGANDDRLLSLTDIEGLAVAAIADGVGGTSGGGVAAELAIAAVKEGVGRRLAFSAVFKDACDRIKLIAQAQPEQAKMATTMSAISFNGLNASVAHVGDTRVYHFRNGGVITRTVDQTEVAELVKQKVLTPQQAKRYPRRNVLLSYLSADSAFNLYECEFEVEFGDTIALLTDGVYNEIRKSELSEIHRSCETAAEFAKAVESLIRERGSRDDSSLVAIRVS